MDFNIKGLGGVPITTFIITLICAIVISVASTLFVLRENFENIRQERVRLIDSIYKQSNIRSRELSLMLEIDSINIDSIKRKLTVKLLKINDTNEKIKEYSEKIGLIKTYNNEIYRKVKPPKTYTRIADSLIRESTMQKSDTINRR